MQEFMEVLWEELLDDITTKYSLLVNPHHMTNLRPAQTLWEEGG